MAVVDNTNNGVQNNVQPPLQNGVTGVLANSVAQATPMQNAVKNPIEGGLANAGNGVRQPSLTPQPVSMVDSAMKLGNSALYGSKVIADGLNSGISTTSGLAVAGLI